MEEESLDSSSLLSVLHLPDSVLLNIFGYLSHVDVCNLAKTCKRLWRVCDDMLLWRNLFIRHFRVDPGVYLEPLYASSWKNEFVRLIDETPMVEVQVLTKHKDQVLHVSFSHDGKRFATTAKDGHIYVWKTGHPVELEYSQSMEAFSWKYTQYSQFNESDTLLLVSGVLFGLHSTSGEIAIFSLKDRFQLQCRTMSKPYDIFGTWYSDSFFFSGNLHWLGNMVSKSVIWINRASQESQSEHTAVMNELYKFYNAKASSVRSLLVANCVDGVGSEADEGNFGNGPTTVNESVDGASASSRELNREAHAGNPVSNLSLEQQGFLRINSRGHRGTLQGAFQNWRPLDNIADINYSDGFRNMYRGTKRAENFEQANCSSSSGGAAGIQNDNLGLSSTLEPSASSSRYSTCDSSMGIGSSTEDLASVEEGNDEISTESTSTTPDDERGQKEVSVEEDHILDPRQKWLIFTCGSETYTPHQIGFKRIEPMSFNGRIDPGPSVQERIEVYTKQRLRELSGEPADVVEWENFDKVADKFDKIDHKMDLHGHIIGMTLSPDHRYLYVNSRPWPEGYVICSALEPPPIASEIDIHVIDLKTLTQVGMMRRAHRAYTPNEECFFIFLDACDQFLASGAEDKHGYVWDRHYGVSLVKLPHTDVVNSVAFNPRNSQMLVTVSDDFSIKIWRSKSQCRDFNLDLTTLKEGTKLYTRKKTSGVSMSQVQSRTVSNV